MAWRDFIRYRPYVLIHREKRGSRLTFDEFVLKLCSGIKNISVSESIQCVVQVQVTDYSCEDERIKNNTRNCGLKLIKKILDFTNTIQHSKVGTWWCTGRVFALNLGPGKGPGSSLTLFYP